jgi:hypothetical protein
MYFVSEKQHVKVSRNLAASIIVGFGGGGYRTSKLVMDAATAHHQQAGKQKAYKKEFTEVLKKWKNKNRRIEHKTH